MRGAAAGGAYNGVQGAKLNRPVDVAIAAPPAPTVLNRLACLEGEGGQTRHDFENFASNTNDRLRRIEQALGLD